VFDTSRKGCAALSSSALLSFVRPLWPTLCIICGNPATAILVHGQSDRGANVGQGFQFQVFRLRVFAYSLFSLHRADGPDLQPSTLVGAPAQLEAARLAAGGLVKPSVCDNGFFPPGFLWRHH